MQWTSAGDTEWRLASQGFEGRASLQETNQGYVATVKVNEKQFDMELMDEREFFEDKEEAIQFLKEKMERDSY